MSLDMRVQRSRVDVLPLTWEVPTAIALVGAVAAAAGVPVGLGIAALGRGEAWSLPGLRETWAMLPGLDTLDLVAIGFVELGVGVVLALAMAWWWMSAGPGATYGVAHRYEVARVLGRGNLRKVAKTIRPDLKVRR